MSRLPATGRVPFALNPVTAAMALKRTASPSQKSQVMMSVIDRGHRGAELRGTRQFVPPEHELDGTAMATPAGVPRVNSAGILCDDVLIIQHFEIDRRRLVIACFARDRNSFRRVDSMYGLFSAVQ